MKNLKFDEKAVLKLHIPNYTREKRKHYIILFTLISVFILVSLISYTKAVSNNLSSSVFRLHVIANSDSTEDQELKYKVRDALIDYMNNLTNGITNKDEVIKMANEHLNDFKYISQNVIKENGFNYDVTVEIGNFDFPTKTYGDIKLPAGFYDALRIKIGEASGKNWWCVMFPPLCFVDVTSGVVPEDSKENLQENLSDEDYSLISNDDTITEFKFKLVEILNNFAIKIANK